MAPHKHKAKSYKTTRNNQNDNFIVCTNRFEPLMEENLLSDDLEMLECEIQAVDTAPGDTGQTLSLFHNERLQDCDKFDKALLKKRVHPSYAGKKIVPIMLHIKIKWGNFLGSYP